MKTFYALMLVALCGDIGLRVVQAEEPVQEIDSAKPKVAAKPKPKFSYQSAGIEIPAATADEPKVAAFGPETIRAARQYLDDGANNWVREKKLRRLPQHEGLHGGAARAHVAAWQTERRSAGTVHQEHPRNSR